MSLCIPHPSCRSRWRLVLLFLVTVPAGEAVSQGNDAPVGPRRDPPARSALPWNVAYDLEVDYTQGYAQRLIADVGETRWVWWAAGDVVLTRDEPAPAGMVERRYYLHNPLEQISHRVGVSAGPVVFGPVLVRGGYRRMMDPGDGGVFPAAAGDETAVLLDGARDPSSWDGAAVATDPSRLPRGRIGADAGVAYLYNPDRAHIALGHIGIAPADARFGRLSVLGSAAEVLDRGRSTVPNHREESWFRETPNPQAAAIRGVAVSYRLIRGGHRDEDDVPVPVFLLVDGYRQGYSWRPRRHAAQGVARIGPPRIRVACRGVAVETGYLDTDVSPPARAAYRGIRLEGMERLPTLREENRPVLKWRGDLAHERRWDDGIPGPLQELRQYRVAFHGNGIFSQCAAEVQWPDDQWIVSAALSTPDRLDLPATGRVSVEHRWSLNTPERRVAVESSLRRTVDVSDGGGSRRTVLRWRVVGETLSSHRGGEQYVWNHVVNVEVPVGNAAAVSVRLGIDGVGTENAEYSGALQFHWSVSGTRSPEATARE